MSENNQDINNAFMVTAAYRAALTKAVGAAEVKIYTLSTCNSWRSYSSMESVSVSLLPEVIVAAAKSELQKPSMKAVCEDLEHNGLSVDELTFDDLLNQKVMCLHVSTAIDGEGVNLNEAFPDAEARVMLPSEINITWSWKQVYEYAKEHGYSCSPEKAKAILRVLDHQHDENHGINWETIDSLLFLEARGALNV